MLTSWSRRCLAAALVALLVAGPSGPLGMPRLGAAIADDDDGGGDDGDDDSDDDGSSSPGSSSDNSSSSDDTATPIFRAPTRQRAPQAPIAVPPPVAATDEIVVWGLDRPQRAAVLAAGYTIRAERSGEPSLILFALPAGQSVDGAIADVAAIAPAALAARNDLYRNQASTVGCEAAICNDWSMVGWTGMELDAMCPFRPFIGIVDTGVNLEHDMLREADVTLNIFGAHAGTASSAKHGTAVVAMFVGDPRGAVPGLVPYARLHVADPFAQSGGDERADTFGLVSAIDHLVAQDVDVVNLSLAGPANVLLEASVERAMAAGIPIVAAAGNAGPASEPLYPAAYDLVVAVTAVDRGKRVYRRAVQGAHIDFAAPGVDISTAASIRGVRPQTGTSFAVPFVTVAVAASATNGVADLVDHLAVRSEDLGDPGRDDVFGHGLIQLEAPCGQGE